jgi:MFS transporter, OFA family, oxalate/formate antiporter
MILVTYGIQVGIGVGIAYLLPMEIVMKWFPNNRGLATSIIMLGSGASGIIFNQVQTQYINPNNIPPDKPYSEQFPDEK